jgi:hypothetical protein
MTDLNCYVTTFNCGRTLVDVDHFAVSFFDGLQSNLPPDLVVLALEEIAPIAYSFLGGTWLVPYFARFIEAVNAAASLRFEGGVKYENVAAKALGMTGILVVARPEVYEQIRWVKTAGVGVGDHSGIVGLGNKGSAAARMGIRIGNEQDEMIVTFVAAHLAPMEWDWERRNEDWKAICEGTVFERYEVDGQGRKLPEGAHPEFEAEPLLSSEGSSGSDEPQGIFSPNSYLIFAGDLNYRTSDKGPGPKDYENWPQPVESVSDIHHYSHLLAKDQLKREQRKGKTLNDLAESEINFPPTYKYSDVAQKQAARAPNTEITGTEGQTWLWAKHRVPSWCDRILYLAATSPTVHSYTALPVQPTSDHRPVVLSFSIPREPLDLNVKPPFPLRKDWKEARATARRYEYLIGVAAYLGLTWEGEALLAGTIAGLVGGYLVLRAMIET